MFRRLILWFAASSSGMVALDANVQRPPTQESPAVPLTVFVYIHAAVQDGTLTAAERKASEVFRRAGIEVEWINCRTYRLRDSAPDPCNLYRDVRHAEIRILPKWRDKGGSIDEHTVGFAAFSAADSSEGVAIALWQRIDGITAHTHRRPTFLLANVIVHELAHLILGA